MTNPIEALQYIKESISDLTDIEWKNAIEEWDFDSSDEYEAYGDTYVRSGSYITTEDDLNFREYFKEENNVDSFIEKLKNDEDFRNSLQEYLESYAETKEIGV